MYSYIPLRFLVYTMSSTRLAVLCAVVGLAYGLDDLTFPPGFKFGVASASYQVEGAWNVSDKTENIWDRYCHDHPDKISGGANGDVACDSYRLWKRDIEMIEEVGAHYYRFSLSWTRLIPNGFTNIVSEDGKNYYNNLIDGLLEKGIEPMITIFHWDLPQAMQDLGGWTNPLIVDWFADYARIAFTLFGDRVKTWITINEPSSFCEPYAYGTYAPGIVSPDAGPYLCNKFTLLAHAKAWRIYDEEFRPKYNGMVSIVNHLVWYEGVTPEDEQLAELALENIAGRYSHPIYSKEGGWPPALKELFDQKSKEQGYLRSKLPDFTQEEIELIRGTYDYYGVNHYTSRLIRPAREGEAVGTWPFGGASDLDAVLEVHPDWKHGSASWFYVYPEGFRKLLVWMKNKYGDIPFIVTENGYSTPSNEGLEDIERINYYKGYLEQVLLAIKEDGVNMTAYTAWTLMDNFEWPDGYDVQFGLYEVDFSSPDRTRTPRASAAFYQQVIATHSLNVDVNKRITK